MTDTQVTGWVGWGWFAAIVVLIAGVFDALYGLIAVLLPGSAYFVAVEGDLFLFDVAGWGWWHLITGILLILVGFALIAGATWARVIAVILVGLNALGQLFLLPVQPWWSLIVLTLDVLVIYALTVHGRELKVAASER
jgi:uncharacterized membrane protein